MNILEFFMQAIGTASLISLATFLSKNLLIEKLKSSLAMENEMRAIVEKSELDLRREFILNKEKIQHEFAMSGLMHESSNANELKKLAMPRKLDSIGKLWQSLVDLKASNVMMLVKKIDSIPESIKSNPALYEIMRSSILKDHPIDDAIHTLNDMLILQNEYNSPFIGYDIWNDATSLVSILKSIFLHFKVEGANSPWGLSLLIKMKIQLSMDSDLYSALYPKKSEANEIKIELLIMMYEISIKSKIESLIHGKSADRENYVKAFNDYRQLAQPSSPN